MMLRACDSRQGVVRNHREDRNGDCWKCFVVSVSVRERMELAHRVRRIVFKELANITELWI